MYIPNKMISCERCGVEVLAKAPNQRFCLMCSKDAERKRDVVRLKNKTKAARPKHEAHKASLTMQQIARQAKEAKMTYGQYVAMMGR